ncbi:MAG: alpha/beta fold hydrolase [Acidobacteria bacterium]|nr:alpha/beta fold hydrolase [Acidobacteriota bacterium]
MTPTRTPQAQGGTTPLAASQIIDRLTPIWQRILQCPQIGVDDNFFDLGGDSSLALQLFDEIAEVFGRELPPVTIYYASTLSTLAALLEGSNPPRFSPSVLLKPGAAEPAVFITHGLGGTVMDFFQVIKNMKTPHPIYGMQARGIDGIDAPFDRIEDMATFYVEAVRKIQPHGPYLLVGYSLGGLVTLEMARQLSGTGEKIALLAMLDSYPHTSRLSPAQRARLAMQQARFRLSTKLKLRSATMPYQHPNENALSPTLQRLREQAYVALEHYQPSFYAGRVKFVRAGTVTGFPADPATVWGAFTQQLEVETIPGDHLGIMTTHHEYLAAALSRYIREALSSERN